MGRGGPGARRRGVGREARAGDHGRLGPGPVHCAPVLVATVGARGHGSPQGGAALPLMVFTTMAQDRSAVGRRVDAGCRYSRQEAPPVG